jgi:hypothetical protein
MAGYFKFFPKRLYTFDKNTVNQQRVTDILARSTFLKEVSENSSVYFKYSVKESDTPEIIAHKIYGDPFRAWIVLLFNNIMDPKYGFPLKEEVLNSYIEKKYSQTITQAKSTIHHYNLNIVKQVISNSTVFSETEENYSVTAGDYNFSTGVLQNRTVPATADTSTSPEVENVLLTNGKTLVITSKVTAVSNYTYEFEENEKKREIRLLDPIYVPNVESEFKKLMQNV